MSESILTEVSAGVGTLVLNRPAVLNTLDLGMAAALDRVSAEFATDPGVRCVVVRGAGDHFMAGGDIGYFRECPGL